MNKSSLNYKNKPQSFEVEFVFSTPIEELGSFGKIDIKSLMTDEVIESLTWEVRCPPSLMFSRDDGSLEERDEKFFAQSLNSKKGIKGTLKRFALREGWKYHKSLGDMPLDLTPNSMPFANQMNLNNTPDRSLANDLKQKTEGTFPVRIYLPKTEIDSFLRVAM